MVIPKDKIEALKEIISAPSRKMVIVTHTNPDGDAIGSILAWGALLEKLGHDVTYIVPNKYPSFLAWMPGIDKVGIFKEKADELIPRINEAEVIFLLDFNQTGRLEGLSDAIAANTSAERILIDHHLDPPQEFDIEFSYVDSSSTSELVYTLITRLGYDAFVTKEVAENIYVGIMTDTGNFSFGHLTPELFMSVAVLAGTGIDIPEINKNIYNNFTEGRVRLLGFALRKMEILHVGDTMAAYITLNEQEMRSFGFQPGDSEGFVNYPLTISGVAISAIFIETKKFIRISFRSRGNVDVNIFARRYFNGGGHKNASGGKAFTTMGEAIATFKKAVTEFLG
jgi:phosphoesterase RecJ-like protein